MKDEPKIEMLQRVDSKRARDAPTRPSKPNLLIRGTAFPNRKNGSPSVYHVPFDRFLASEIRMLQFDSGANLQRFASIGRQPTCVFDGHGSKTFVEHIDHSYLGRLHVGACTAAAAKLGVNDLLD
jgi:hypothetical protein